MSGRCTSPPLAARPCSRQIVKSMQFKTVMAHSVDNGRYHAQGWVREAFSRILPGAFRLGLMHRKSATSSAARWKNLGAHHHAGGASRKTYRVAIFPSRTIMTSTPRVARRLAGRSGPPGEASAVLNSLRPMVRGVDEVRMIGPQLAGDLV